jgi:hypothetical protein
MRYEENGVFDRMTADAQNAGASVDRSLSGAFTTVQGSATNMVQVTKRQLETIFKETSVGAEREFNIAHERMRQLISASLSVPRNAAGSLDLDVPGLQRAADAQQARATAAQEAAIAIRRAAEAEGDYSSQARLTIAAADALSKEERDLAAAKRDHAEATMQLQAQLNQEASATTHVTGVMRGMASANDNGSRSAGAHRAAMMNLGQQFQDATIQAQMGTSALTIFTQQGSQAAFAMAGLGGRIGAAATVLAGPWGAALFAGTALLGPFISGLFDAGTEADRSAAKIDNMADALDRLNAAQGRVTMLQLGYAQADVFQKEGTVNRLVGMRPRIANNVGLAGGIGAYDQSIEKARDELTAAQDLLKVSKMRAEVQARAEAADKSAEAAKKQAKEDERAAKAADRAARAAERHANSLQEFGKKSAETIQRTTEQFDRQPTAIDKAAQAIRGLDAVMADLAKRRPIGFAKMVEEAEAAKSVVVDSLLRPIEDMERSSERRLKVQDLLAQGRETEAAALQNVWSIEDKLGSEEELRAKVQDLIADGRKDEAAAFERLLAMYPGMKRQAAELAEVEAQRTREAERQKALFDAQLNVIETARGSLTDLLSGRDTDFVGSIKQALKDLQGARLADQLFGDTFAEIEDQLRQRSPLGKATSRLTDSVGTAGASLDQLATAVEGATKRIGSAGVDGAVAASRIDGNEVTVAGTRPGAAPVGTKNPTDLTKLTIQQLAEKTAHATVDPLLAGFDDIMGTRFFQSLSGTISGALAGTMTGGAVGGILGGARGAVFDYGPDVFGKGMTDKLLGKFDDALGGAQTGSMAAGLMKGLGLKTSTTGAQIGGAIGGLTGIPGGDIIGSIAGGLLGGLFKTNRTARALVTGVDSSSVAGKDSGNYGTASGLGDSVIGNLNNIVEKLGGSVGSFLVAIGTRGDEYRVNPNGGSLKTNNGAISFGDDAEAAIAFAVKNAIEDGAIKGMRASTLNIIKAGDDLEAALQDALDWEGIFRELKSYKDPLGAAMDDLDKEFERYIELAKTAGASSQEMADLQELYGIKQAEAVEEYKDRILGSLQGLYDGLTTGDNGLSLRDRQAAALGTYDDLAARVSAGDSTAYDDYATAAQTLLDIERELYGSQQEYFDRLNEVTDLTKTRIDAETNVTSIAENRDSPFDATGAVKSSIDSQTDQTVSRLDAVNENLGRALSLLSQIAANGGTMPSSGSPRISLPSYF